MVRMDEQRRRRITFAVRFVVILLILYVVVALNQVNDRVIVPFTEVITGAVGALMRGVDPHVQVSGTTISSGAFAIDVRNGCNAVETMMLFTAALLAFPASPRRRLIGLVIGLPLIQLLNVVRLASLLWLGVHHRPLFDLFHVAVWQAVMILIGVAIFAAWSSSVTTQSIAHSG